MARRQPLYDFDRHSPDYREKFLDITHEMHQRCPIAWTDTYDGHWVAAGSEQVFELARCPHVSNDHDVHNERRGYKGISIPTMLEGTVHYDSIGVIQGMRHLPAMFSPGTRRGPGVAETVAKLQRICDEQGLARPITEFKASAEITE